jgi:hypothetical protein
LYISGVSTTVKWFAVAFMIKKRIAWITATLVMIGATLAIVLVVYFKFVAAKSFDHYEFSVDQTGFFLQENKSVNSNPPDYVSVLKASGARLMSCRKHTHWV